MSGAYGPERSGRPGRRVYWLRRLLAALAILILLIVLIALVYNAIAGTEVNQGTKSGDTAEKADDKGGNKTNAGGASSQDDAVDNQPATDTRKSDGGEKQDSGKRNDVTQGGEEDQGDGPPTQLAAASKTKSRGADAAEGHVYRADRIAAREQRQAAREQRRAARREWRASQRYAPARAAYLPANQHGGFSAAAAPGASAPVVPAAPSTAIVETTAPAPVATVPVVTPVDQPDVAFAGRGVPPVADPASFGAAGPAGGAAPLAGEIRANVFAATAGLPAG